MHTVTTISHLPGLSHLDNFYSTNRLATLTLNSSSFDWWQASTPTHLPGLKSYGHLTVLKRYCILISGFFINKKKEFVSEISKF
jgi:hypothetical protein